MLLGAVFWSVYADKCGRRNAFILSLACIFIAGLASAFAPSFYMLLFFRAIVGFGVGGSLPVTTVLISEFLPTSHRAAVLCRLSGMFWAAGLIITSLLGLVLSRTLGPGQEEEMWRLFLGLSAIPGAMVLVAYKLLPESPRYLSVVGRHGEAVKVLEEVARVNGVTNVLGVELSQLTSDEERVGLNIERSSINFTGNENGADAGDVRELFRTPTLRRATISIYYGLVFLLPKYYKEFSDGAAGFVYIISAVLGVALALASFFSLWLCSEDRLGRVGTMKWSSFATAVLILLLALSYDTPVVFLPVTIVTFFVFGVPSVVKFVVTPELYNTKHRAVAVGSATVWTRIGGILAPVLAEILYDKGPVWPLAVFGPSMIVVAIFSVSYFLGRKT
eukprot:jgi/Undpi1/12116/HiC_scaffold_48.g14089.m1